MVQTTRPWEFVVDRGPDCLFVKLRMPDGQSRGSKLQASKKLVEELWLILSKHFTYRLVLEMDDVDRLPSPLIEQLVMLKARIQQHGGMLRLCGLSDTCRQAIRACQLPDSLPNYHDRTDAVVGHHASVPH
jgi:anti-anti-sigma regulatory factor